jgi:hypothetical protein
MSYYDGRMLGYVVIMFLVIVTVATILVWIREKISGKR